MQNVNDKKQLSEMPLYTSGYYEVKELVQTLETQVILFENEWIFIDL